MISDILTSNVLTVANGKCHGNGECSNYHGNGETHQQYYCGCGNVDTILPQDR